MRIKPPDIQHVTDRMAFDQIRILLCSATRVAAS